MGMKTAGPATVVFTHHPARYQLLSQSRWREEQLLPPGFRGAWGFRPRIWSPGPLSVALDCPRSCCCPFHLRVAQALPAQMTSPLWQGITSNALPSRCAPTWRPSSSSTSHWRLTAVPLDHPGNTIGPVRTATMDSSSWFF